MFILFIIDQVVDSSSDQNNLCAFFLVTLSYICVVLTFPIGFIFCIKVVQEYERAVIFRLGRNLSGGGIFNKRFNLIYFTWHKSKFLFNTAKGPGLFFVLPCVDECSTIDLRTITFDVPPQEILTRDSVTITVDAVIYYRIFDPVQSVNKVANAQYSTRLLAATSLRNILGTKTLQEILVDKESIAHHMQELLDTATDEWYFNKLK